MVDSQLSDPTLSAASVIVTAQQMQAIEAALFATGMPIAALMEKVAGKITRWILQHFPRDRTPQVGVIVGPGHNGGDALVVARELHHHGYQVVVWCPFTQVKTLTAQHKAYAEYLGVRMAQSDEPLKACELIVDGGFGSGLTRPLEGALAQGIESLNNARHTVVSIDLPTGLATDTGQVLGIAVRADHTLCLGLWKLGLLQDQAQPWVGQRHLIPFDVPAKAIRAVLSDQPISHYLTPAAAIARLPLPRSPLAHKYKAGSALLIAGSRQYAGAALLAGHGAIASGVGMLTLIVPESLRLMAVSQLPEALVIGAAETSNGAIAALPDELDWQRYDTVACGPGLTQTTPAIVTAVLQSDRPVVLDADGLNLLSQSDPQRQLTNRSAPTLLTPHPGEFRRLFPDLAAVAGIAGIAARQAAVAAQCTIVLKGALSAIAHRDGQLWINPESSAALARGGSGDVLTGLVTGLAAQLGQSEASRHPLLNAAIAAVWWHAQAGRSLASQNTDLGCAPSQLARALPTVLATQLTLAPTLTTRHD